jgi:hypothetical protein
MPDSVKETLTARTETHSDVAESEAARQHQASLTERQFADLLIRRLREAQGELRLTHFQRGMGNQRYRPRP